MTKKSKLEVKYQSKPKGKERCGLCTMFVQPDKCTDVNGEISPQGWCNIFYAKKK